MEAIEEKIINGFRHIQYPSNIISDKELLTNSLQFYHQLNQRRSVREFSNHPVPRRVIENLIRTASTAPSGAHKQPWTFCAISDPKLKSKIREAAESEEKKSYQERMSDRWKEDLMPIGTDMHKPFLEIAPWLIIVFKKAFDRDDDGNKMNNYYVNESIGIACGMLISAIHQAGLATLTHTPSPMNFLTRILDRPENERAFLLLPVGFPANPTFVPDLKRKSLTEVSVFYD